MEGHKVSDKDTARPWWLRMWGDEGRMARRENRAMEAATEEERGEALCRVVGRLATLSKKVNLLRIIRAQFPTEKRFTHVERS